MFLWLDTPAEGSTSGGIQSPLRSAGAPCDVIRNIIFSVIQRDKVILIPPKTVFFNKIVFGGGDGIRYSAIKAAFTGKTGGRFSVFAGGWLLLPCD
jgi:hypothetical protein